MKKDFAYAHLAPWYEYLSDDCDYENWSQYFVNLLKSVSCDPAGKKGIDLGCGSGYFARSFSRLGVAMSGVDISAEMLSVAEEKTREEGLCITYMQGDLAKFKTFEKYDFACAANDLFNYVPKNRLLPALKNAARLLKKGGAFVFDISSKRKFLTKIRGKVSADDREDITYLSFGNVENDVATLDVTLFIRRKDGAFDRFDEVHTQYIYEKEEIACALSAAGFDPVIATGMYGEDENTADRLCFLAVKK